MYDNTSGIVLVTATTRRNSPNVRLLLSCFIFVLIPFQVILEREKKKKKTRKLASMCMHNKVTRSSLQLLSRRDIHSCQLLTLVFFIVSLPEFGFKDSSQ